MKRPADIFYFVLLFLLQLVISDYVHLGPWICLNLIPLLILLIPLSFRPHAVLLIAFGDDGLEGLHEAVDFAERLAFSRLDHQGFMHREREGRGVEAEVHEAFGHVGGIYAVEGLELTEVDDAFVGDTAGGTCVESLQFRQETGRHVVGVEDGDFRDFAEAFRTEQFDVRVGDGRPTRNTRPNSSCVPRSPVRNQPSEVKTALVAASFL